jgi:hypothetical protein
MLLVLQESVLVLLITILMGVRYETVQNVPRQQPSQFHETRVENPQVQFEQQPDAGRYPPVMGELLPSAEGSP